MRVKVTYPMAKVIQEAMPKDHSVKLVKLTPKEYAWHVHYGGIYHAEDHGDYDWKTGKCKAIQIIYPSDYYAMPQYITSKDLNDYFRECAKDGEVTIERWKEKLKEALEV